VNVGDIAVNLTSFSVSDSPNNDTLQSGLGLCIDGVYNGLLTAYPWFNNSSGTNSVTPVALGLGAATAYGVDLYAGEAPTYCGGGDVVSTPLAAGAAGGSDTVTITAGFTG
jgi:hypothetical protein